MAEVGSVDGARAPIVAGGIRASVKILAGVLLLIVIVVAVNAILVTQQPALKVVNGGLSA